MSFPVSVGFDWHKAGGRREYLRAKLEDRRAVPYSNQSSGILLSASWADGLVEIPEGGTLKAGDMARFIPFCGLF